MEATRLNSSSSNNVEPKRINHYVFHAIIYNSSHWKFDIFFYQLAGYAFFHRKWIFSTFFTFACRFPTSIRSENHFDTRPSSICKRLFAGDRKNRLRIHLERFLIVFFEIRRSERQREWISPNWNRLHHFGLVLTILWSRIRLRSSSRIVFATSAQIRLIGDPYL